MSATQIPSREVALLSDSQSLSQQDRVGELEDKLIAAFASQLSDRIDGAKIGRQPMEDISRHQPTSAIRRDSRTFEIAIGGTAGGRRAWKDRSPRVFLREEQPVTQTPKPSRP